MPFLLPKLNEYDEPELEILFKIEVKNYFPSATDEQIDDLFEYFEDENNLGLTLTVANLVQVIEEEFILSDDKSQPVRLSRIYPCTIVYNYFLSFV